MCALTRSVLLLAVVFSAGRVGECQAQGLRRLQSRALFSALDSTDLADSSAMEPVNPHADLDSVMLDMVAFLDGNVGRNYGVGPTRLRIWNGFGTQAHPQMGILVDRDEIAGLLEKVRQYKGAAGVPEEKIDPRLEFVVRFLTAHEYGHLMQYGYFGRDSVANLNATRVIECGADLLGGFDLRAYLASRYHEGAFPEAAEEAAIDFGYVVGGSDWLDGTTHPLPEERRHCIERGVEVQRNLMDSQGQRTNAAASSQWLRDSEPELYRGETNLMRWSNVRARAIVAAWEVVDSNAVLAVVRDSSPSRLVRHLADAAAMGSAELRRFRGDRAPSETGGYLLREALPVPWQCITAESRGVERAVCKREGREQDFAKGTFERLVKSVREALAGTRWQPIKGKPDFIPEGRAAPDVLAQALYGFHGAGPNDPAAPRIDILFVEYPVGMVMQIPPKYEVSIMFRARR